MRKINRRTILLLALLLTSLSGLAQTVGYKASGCSIKCGVARQDTTYYVTVMLKSDKFAFLNEPVMMLKTFDDQVIKLQGTNIGNSTKSEGGVVVGYAYLSETKILSSAQFKITAEQLELLNTGVAKIRLSTSPFELEKTFKKDKVGKKLYEFFTKYKDNEF